MKPIKDYEFIEESGKGGKKLPAGGYVIKITDVWDDAKNERMELTFDIHEGDFAGHYSDEFAKNNPWTHTIKQSYSEKAVGLFKHLISCIEKSNAGYEWNWEERSLVGKIVGASFQYEEYVNKKGEKKERFQFPDYFTADEVRNGKWTIKEFKPLDAEQDAKVVEPEQVQATIIDGDDFPF